MYSLVMLAAMTTAPEVPQFNGFFKNLFFGHWHGHHGVRHGYGCGGCGGYTAGYSCGGCTGSYYSGCSGCNGCYGVGYSCHGTVTVGSSCYGSSCQGVSCYGGVGFSGCTGYTYSYGCSGCQGYSYSSPSMGCSGGCTGNYYTGCQGYSSYPTYAAPIQSYSHSGTAEFHQTNYAPTIENYSGIPESFSSLQATRAQLVVKVPEGAKLYADGQRTELTGSNRTFMTPELAAGKDYKYSLRIEYVENGETKSMSQDVMVRAGHRTAVDLGAKNATTENIASKSAPKADEKAASTVTVKLPSNGKLTVDGMVTSVRAGEHTFRTPELAKGQTFTYQFEAELDNEGKKETVSEKVVFKAGEPVTVDFTRANLVRTASNVK